MKRANSQLLTIIFLMFSINTTQAQLLKKIKNRVEQKVENVIVEKTSDKAAEKTSKSMDKILNTNPFNTGNTKASPDLIADSYTFHMEVFFKNDY